MNARILWNRHTIEQALERKFCFQTGTKYADKIDSEPASQQQITEQANQEANQAKRKASGSSETNLQSMRIVSAVPLDTNPHKTHKTRIKGSNKPTTKTEFNQIESFPNVWKESK